MERGAYVRNVGLKHESPRTASANSRLPATAALRRAGLLFAFLDLSPRALRHEDTPWNLSAPVQLKCPACRVFMHRARLLRPLTVALCVSVLLLASHTPRSTDSRPPRRLAEAQHSANGGWAWVSECAVSWYDIMASSESAGLRVGGLAVTGGAEICAKHTDANFGWRARAQPPPHGAHLPPQRIRRFALFVGGLYRSPRPPVGMGVLRSKSTTRTQNGRFCAVSGRPQGPKSGVAVLKIGQRSRPGRV